MTQYLPISGFNLLTQEEINKLNANTIREVCVVEADLEYPEELHDLHKDYLFQIKENILSGQCKKIANENNISIDKTKKLATNQNENVSNKSKCVVHYRTLHSHLQLGIKLVKTRKFLKFKQSQ